MVTLEHTPWSASQAVSSGAVTSHLMKENTDPEEEEEEEGEEKEEEEEEKEEEEEEKKEEEEKDKKEEEEKEKEEEEEGDRSALGWCLLSWLLTSPASNT